MIIGNHHRAVTVLTSGGGLGFIAPNTIGQGDPRESGLTVIFAQCGRISFAKRFIPSPGQATVEVNLVGIEAHRRSADHPNRTTAILNHRPVSVISSHPDDQTEHEPIRFPSNAGTAWIGDMVRGIGGIPEPAEAYALPERDPRNAHCLFSYLNGTYLNSHPTHQPSRWVICFHNWNLAQAQHYPDVLRIVEERVRPNHEQLNEPGDRRYRAYWWQFGAYRTGMRAAIAPLHRVPVRSEVSPMHMGSFVPKEWIYPHMIVIVGKDDDHFALLCNLLCMRRGHGTIPPAWYCANALPQPTVLPPLSHQQNTNTWP